MSNELPPETAHRLLSFYLDYSEMVAERRGGARNAAGAITDEDIKALRECCRDVIQYSVTITANDIESDGCGWGIVDWPLLCMLAAVQGLGGYDHYERAGWVKREDKPAAESEEWGEWVKLAVVGERPDGLLDEELVNLRNEDGSGGNWKAGDAFAWKFTTHYRRKRIRSLVKADHDFVNFVWAEHREHPPRDLMPGHYCLRGQTWTPATVPEVTAAKAGRDPNGVVAWWGGDCPVGEGTNGVVHFRRRATGRAPDVYIELYRWRHLDSNSGGDIIAYEVTP